MMGVLIIISTKILNHNMHTLFIKNADPTHHQNCCISESQCFNNASFNVNPNRLVSQALPFLLSSDGPNQLSYNSLKSIVVNNINKNIDNCLLTLFAKQTPKSLIIGTD